MSAPSSGPIAFDEVLAAEARIRPHLPPTPLRAYAPLDAAVGGSIRVLVKHENHAPTNSFKVRNGLSFVSALGPEERRRGVVAATRGNHGLGVSYAGARFGVPVTICVPVGNNPEKNEGIRGYGAELIEGGADYDASVELARTVVRERGAALVHSTNDARVIAGAATLSLEVLRARDDVEAMVIAVGGGSQAVGAITVARELRPDLPIYGVQAERASAIHDSWHAGVPLAKDSADTFADGLATRNVYEATFPALRSGLAGFITVGEAEIAAAMRLVLRTTHNLVEPAGAAGVAGLLRLRDVLAGKTVVVVLSGANVDQPTLRRVLAEEI